MADTLYIKDGSVEFLLREDSFERILRDRLGNDVADYYKEIFDEIKDDADSAVGDMRNELEDVKFDLSENKDCFSDLLKKLEDIEIEIEKSKISKEVIGKIVFDMQNKIYNQLS